MVIGAITGKVAFEVMVVLALVTQAEPEPRLGRERGKGWCVRWP